ncbi:MAG: PGPGW domain-containing protein [Actinomycetota bacterium]|nr:PGPGW domain-containing protein [Actinomycetota bacterium]
MSKPSEVLRFIGRNAKRLAVTIVGGVVLVAGLTMLVLPGPAIVVVPLGFAILATEYAWAAVALNKSKDMVDSAGKRTKKGLAKIKKKKKKKKVRASEGSRRVQ